LVLPHQILSKGKVLYPITAYTSESDKAQKELELSQRLTDLSANHQTPVLLVVGTPSQRQEEWLEGEEQQQKKQQQRLQLLQSTTAASNSNNGSRNKDLWSFLTTLTVGDVLHFGWHVATTSIRYTFHGVWLGMGLVRDGLFGWQRPSSTNGRASATAARGRDE
jgi:hypothetical protein